MQKRELGRSGIQVPVLCLGGNVFGWTADEKQTFELLDAALDAGLNFVDTADVYSNWVPGNKGGESEALIGKWCKARGNRREVVLATKAGLRMGEGKKGLSRRYLREAIEASLSRLQTDYLDIYQAHKDDESVPQEETLGTFAELIKEGKVRAIGASNFTAPRLASALEVSQSEKLPRYEALQPEYNLYDRSGYEAALENVCRQNGLGVTPYFSLASGFLSGKYHSQADTAGRPRATFLKKYFNERGTRILAALDEVATILDSKPARVALAWLIARPGITAPIASATTREQIQELAEASRLKLPAEAIDKLNKASAQ